MRSPSLGELSFVVALLIAAAAFLVKGVLPGSICAALAIFAALVFWTPLGDRLGWLPGKRESASAHLAPVDRLRPTLSEGVALVARLDPACPALDVLRPARAWQRRAYAMLAGERRDLAQRFLDAAPPVEERETQSSTTVNPARLIMEEQTAVLKEIIDQLEHDQ
jgi:hypothetical protein